ncbi:hypothetical protein BJY01DRAFT_226370 [Aspergillus pseudoustus]|uniref:Secreted protein n=1 Tax=Aspergillus pseudoustus TaxID=1810923 RepID=A0ABR4IVV5_9EURO
MAAVCWVLSLASSKAARRRCWCWMTILSCPSSLNWMNMPLWTMSPPSNSSGAHPTLDGTDLINSDAYVTQCLEQTPTDLINY